MRQLAYTRLELVRTLRSKRFLALSLGFPLGLYFLIAGPNRDVQNLAGTGLSAPLYFMTGLASFGTIAACLSSGVRIAGDREAGWTRQLRIAPLPAPTYLRSKLVTSYALALVTIGAMYASGAALGVRLTPAEWLRITALLVIGLVPFAAMGIALGHALSTEAIGPAMGGITSALAFASGAWFPLGHGALAEVARWLPSYWLIQASRVALTGRVWPVEGWLVIAGWSVALAALAGYAYRRDTRRI